MMSFADKVKDARAARGLTQPQLAEMIGLTVRSIVAYEAGEKVKMNIIRNPFGEQQEKTVHVKVTERNDRQ